jgi:FkbM family methyltransferase
MAAFQKNAILATLCLAASVGVNLAAPHTHAAGSHRGHYSVVASIPPWARVDSMMRRDAMNEVQAQPKGVEWYGLFKEDEYAHQHFFHGLHNGTYLDLGAHDGVGQSNTKALSDSFGWRGILIDANPDLFKRLVANRPHDICVHSAVCAMPGKVHYVLPKLDFVGGIWELMAPTFLKTWHPELADSPKGLPEVTCLPLSSILGQLGARHINFFSLDVEGGELSVLQTLDFGRVTFDVIVVEADSHDPVKNQNVVDLLTSHGYRPHGQVESNAWFVNRAYNPRSFN